MPFLGVFPKDKDEFEVLSVDFAPDTPGAGSAVTVKKMSDGSDGSAILNGAVQISGTKLVQAIQGGIPDEKYMMQFKADISVSRKPTGHVRVDVFDY